MRQPCHFYSTNDLFAYSSSREGKAGLASNRGPAQHSKTIALTSNTGRLHHQRYCLSPNHPPSVDAGGEHDEHYFDSGASHRGPE